MPTESQLQLIKSQPPKWQTVFIKQYKMLKEAFPEITWEESVSISTKLKTFAKHIFEQKITQFPYTNEQIATAFGCTQSNIREHKSKHKGELLRNVDYVSNPDSNYKIFWSKSGAIKLADWIGTDKAKLFISQWIEKTVEKPFKEITPNNQIAVPETNQIQPTNIQNLPENQLFTLMEMTLTSLRRQSERMNTLETRLEQIANQKATLNVIEVRTAKDFKTLKESKKNEIGVEINALIREKYLGDVDFSGRTNVEIQEMYKHAHRQARNDYWDEEQETYVGAKKASYESKVKFLNWLKKVKV